MAAVIGILRDQYHFYMDKADPRVEHLPFMSCSPFLMAAFLGFYVYFVTDLGQRLMKDRPPFHCTGPMIVYNLIQVTLNAHLVFKAFQKIWFPMKHNLFCAEVDYSDNPGAKTEAFYVWFYFFLKFLDLFDTVFMVLRKKNGQITFLHVYHHTGMAAGTWFVTKVSPGGYGIFFGTINAFVHTVMYSYYLVTALQPEYKKNIWWKRHITELQLAQFVVVALHGIVHVVNPHCNYPKYQIVFFVAQNLVMIVMFTDFYVRAYLSKKQQRKET